MSKTLYILVLAAVLATPAFAAPAQPADLPRYDASTAPDLASKLALCDTTAFLASNPDLDADRILAPRDAQPYLRLTPPYFVANGFIHGRGYDRLFQKLRDSGRLTRDQLADAQFALGRGLIDAYRPRHPLPRDFVRAQLTYCSQWGRTFGVNVDF